MRFIVLTCLLLSQGLSAQVYQWAEGYGTNGQNRAKDVTSDFQGNAIFTGWVSGQVNMGSTSMNPSLTDSYIAKYDQQGNILWVTPISGNNKQESFRVETDPWGNIFVTGRFLDEVTVKSTTLQSTGSVSSYDAFLVKLDPNGNLLWLRQGGGNNDDFGSGLATDSSGNVMMSGFFENSASFGSLTVSGAQGDEAYVVKYDSSGTALWAKAFTGVGNDNADAITTDLSGNIYIGINFQDSISIGSGTFHNGSSLPYLNFIIAKLSPQGNPLWVKPAGAAIGDDYVRDMITKNGKVYVAGSFSNTFNLGSVSFTKQSFAGPDRFALQMDTAGQAEWVYVEGNESHYGIDANLLGDVYVAATQQDVVVTAIDSLGNLKWKNVSGSGQADEANGIAVTPAGDIYVAGSIQASANFDSIVVNMAPGMARNIVHGNISGTSVNCIQPQNVKLDSNSCAYLAISWQSADSSSFMEYGLQGFQKGQGIFQGRVSKPYSINNLQAGTTYDIYIADTCSGGILFNAGPFTFTTDSMPLPSAQIIKLNDSISGGLHHFSLHADSSSNASTYWWDLGNGDTAAGKSVVASFATGGSFTIQLVAGNACGSDTTTLILNSKIGLSEFQFTDVQVFPNPVNNNLNVKLPEQWTGGDYSFSIYSFEGRLLKESHSSQKQIKIDLSGFTEGGYIWQASTEENSTRGIFIKE